MAEAIAIRTSPWPYAAVPEGIHRMKAVGLSKLFYRSAFIAGLGLLILSLWLSFTLPVSDHYKYVISAPIALVGVAIGKWAKDQLRSTSR